MSHYLHGHFMTLLQELNARLEYCGAGESLETQQYVRGSHIKPFLESEGGRQYMIKGGGK